MISRREFLTYGSAAAAFIGLNGCASESTVTAGRLYFSTVQSPLPPSKIERMAEKVKQNFEDVGISFASVDVGDVFPKLSGLDMLFILTEGMPYTTLGGMMGLRSPTAYELLKKRTGFPYDPLTAAVHLGFVATDAWEAPYLFDNEPSEQVKEDLPIIISMHEIGHGFIAQHTTTGKRESCDQQSYFMTRSVTKAHRFHPTTVKMMKDFITLVNKKSYKTQKEQDLFILEARLKSWEGYVNICPKTLFSEIF